MSSTMAAIDFLSPEQRGGNWQKIVVLLLTHTGRGEIVTLHKLGVFRENVKYFNFLKQVYWGIMLSFSLGECTC